MRHILPAAAIAVTGAAALIAYPHLLRAADETPHDAVERLLPQLMSEDDATRTDAEKQLFALGQPARSELEKVTRENDPHRAITALRLLQERKWGRSLRAGEEPLRRDGDARRDEAPREGPVAGHDLGDLDSLRARLEHQLDELRNRFEDFDRDFAVHLPQLGVTVDSLHGRSSGTIAENDSTLSWSTDESGHVKVTVKDGKDAPESTFEAKDMDELKKEHPDIAARLEKAMPRQNGRGFVFRFDPQKFPTWRDEEDRGRDTDRSRQAPFSSVTQTVLLGIEWSPLSDVMRDQLDIGNGVVVESVVKGSLAEKLGLARNDILLEVGGKPVNSSADVRAVLEPMKAGESVKALVLRKGQRKTLEAAK